jgi:hypothetical protein
MSAFEHHEPHVIFIEYDMCSLLLFQPLQIRTGTRITMMSIRLDVNQSTFLCLESPRESYLYLCKDYVMKYVI